MNLRWEELFTKDSAAEQTKHKQYPVQTETKKEAAKLQPLFSL